MSDAIFQEVTAYPHGAFSWAELLTTDREGAAEFYSALLGWGREDRPIGDSDVYTMLTLDGKYVAGLYQMPPEQMPGGAAWATYISVESADAAAAQAQASGGSVVAGPFDVQDNGRMVTIQDPTGAMLGLWQPYGLAGSAYYGKPGSMGWNELYTHDVAAATEFYKSLLGWGVQMTTYQNQPAAACFRAEFPVAMILPLLAEMAGLPPAWLIYFGVENVPQAGAQVQALGGTLLIEPTVFSGVPYALARDPQGAVFFMAGAPVIEG